MAENVANKWSALLNGAIDNDDTSVAYDTAVGTLPAVNFRAVIQDSESDDTNREIVLVTAGTSSPLTVTRAQEGTTGVSHADDSYITHVLTAGALNAVLGAYGVKVYRNAAFSLSAGITSIQFDTEVRDDGNFWSSGSNTRLTFPVAGWYMFGGTCGVLTNSDSLETYVRLNGTTDLDAGRDYETTNAVTRRSNLSSARYFSASDYIELRVNTGAADAISVGSEAGTLFWAVRIPFLGV